MTCTFYYKILDGLIETSLMLALRQTPSQNAENFANYVQIQFRK